MKSNQKVDMTLEALDLELEILEKSQQQVIMGGSARSNGSNSSNGVPDYQDPNKIDAMMAQCFNPGGGSAGGLFCLNYLCNSISFSGLNFRLCLSSFISL